jgi:DNA repair protein RadC
MENNKEIISIVQEHGVRYLNDIDIIASLIYGSVADARAAAKRVHKKAEYCLINIGKFSIEQLQNIEGVGLKSALSILSAVEFGKRRSLAEPDKKEKIRSSACVFRIMQPILGDLPHEEFWVLYLNNSNNVIKKSQLSKGGITGTLVDIRLIFSEALVRGATCLVLCHNHPSGSLIPSSADKNLTEKVKKAGLGLDIKILDHCIITRFAFYSFADEHIL